MVTIICPHVNDEELEPVRKRLEGLPVVFKEDVLRIGSDMMYQSMWNTIPGDIFIYHADMLPMDEDLDNRWWTQILEYVEEYPDAGMIGCKLLYPVKDQNNNWLIQHAGGKFTDGQSDHFGGGYDFTSNSTYKSVEPDVGQYDFVRRVAWCTFGGVYIRREVLSDVGNFDTSFEDAYERDVDYCLEARRAGWEIYMTPVPLMHLEGKDNNRILTDEIRRAQMRNRRRLAEKWEGTGFLKTLDERID